MKSTTKQKQDKLSFPCLMKSTKNSTIILVNRYNNANKAYTGIVVYGTDEDEVGKYHSCWDASLFEIYNGEVTLSND